MAEVAELETVVGAGVGVADEVLHALSSTHMTVAVASRGTRFVAWWAVISGPILRALAQKRAKILEVPGIEYMACLEPSAACALPTASQMLSEVMRRVCVGADRAAAARLAHAARPATVQVQARWIGA